jgi:hypothetical protein
VISDAKSHDLPTRPDDYSSYFERAARGDGCIINKMVGKCGPYRYYVKRINGRQHWKYLGKAGQQLVNVRVGKIGEEGDF